MQRTKSEDNWTEGYRGQSKKTTGQRDAEDKVREQLDRVMQRTK